MIKKEINRADIFRALLTDTLPYEVPFPFSNTHFHSIIARQRNDLPEEICNSILKKKPFSIPYNYNISKDQFSSRKLSIPHPKYQLDICMFYDQYADLILEYCSKSSFSLRKPTRVASHFYEKNLTSNTPPNSSNEEPEVEQETLPFEEQTKTASSYFSYGSYSLIHKFYDSYEFINLEKRFKLLKLFDISKCFYNIYTHTISWAVKSKEFAKENIKSQSSFESTFDNIMQGSNYSETNGIIVGPEFSRIFAEIILQSIDRKIEDTLKEKYNLTNNRDYVVKRYVDDYFLFSNNETTADLIHNLFKSHLEEYKLYLNEKKIDDRQRPFIDPISISKIAASSHIEAFFDGIFDRTKKTLSSHRKISRTKLALINNFRSISSTNKVQFSSFGKFSISIILGKTKTLHKEIFNELDKSEHIRTIRHINNHILELLFYLYAMDCSVRTTYLIGKHIFNTLDLSKKLDSETIDATQKKIFDLASSHISYNTTNSINAPIETLNLLIILKELGSKYLLSEKAIANIFKLKESNNSLDTNKNDMGYFQIVVFYYYTEDLSIYNPLRLAVTKHVLSLFSQAAEKSQFSHNSEIYLLLLDLIACPWVDQSVKNDIIGLYIESQYDSIKISKKNAKAKSLIAFISKRTWFFDWNSSNHIRQLLLKKELSTPY